MDAKSLTIAGLAGFAVWQVTKKGPLKLSGEKQAMAVVLAGAAAGIFIAPKLFPAAPPSAPAGT
jgi:hypothetical protein